MGRFRSKGEKRSTPSADGRLHRFCESAENLPRVSTSGHGRSKMAGSRDLTQRRDARCPPQGMTVGATSRPSTASTPRRRAEAQTLEKQGVWEPLWRAVLATLTARRSWRGPRRSWTARSSRQKEGACVGLTRKGKGTKIMAVTDGNGLPIGVLIESEVEGGGEAGQGDAGDGVRRPTAGPPADAAGAAHLRPGLRQPGLPAYLTRRGIRHAIPMKRRPKNWKPRLHRLPASTAP